MMDYYEELGVSRTASTDEIRRAYKHLVGLLHPDRCLRGPAHALAEIQTKRLNGILSVLSHEESRAQYDRSLLDPIGQPAVPLPHQAGRAPEWFWPALGLLALVILVYLVSPERTTSSPAIVQQAAPVQVSLPAVPAVKRRNPRRSEVRPEVSQAAVAPLPGPPEVPLISNSESAVTEPLQPRKLPIEPVPPPAVASQPPQFTGNWLLSSSVPVDHDGLYPPEYIELHLTESSGNLRGRYKARYRVPDRAISPSVSFDFTGPANGSTEAVLHWTGPGGSRGQVSLHLNASGMLEIQWAADRIGEELGLISGRATLVRRLE
jgi:hypothetical protein